jgi:hypothetical protein
LHRLLFSVNLFEPQIPQSRNDGRQKQNDRRQGRKHGKPVLPVRREALPPTLGACDRGNSKGRGKRN